jgi:hypothetical protein
MQDADTDSDGESGRMLRCLDRGTCRSVLENHQLAFLIEQENRRAMKEGKVDRSDHCYNFLDTNLNHSGHFGALAVVVARLGTSVQRTGIVRSLLQGGGPSRGIKGTGFVPLSCLVLIVWRMTL